MLWMVASVAAVEYSSVLKVAVEEAGDNSGP